MELLLGAGTMVLVEVYKWLVIKFGKKNSEIAIYIVVFVIAVGIAAVTKTNLISKETLEYVGMIFASAVAIYEVIVKWLLKNVLGLSQ